jgi:hypothetical protein
LCRPEHRRPWRCEPSDAANLSLGAVVVPRRTSHARGLAGDANARTMTVGSSYLHDSLMKHLLSEQPQCCNPRCHPRSPVRSTGRRCGPTRVPTRTPDDARVLRRDPRDALRRHGREHPLAEPEPERTEMGRHPADIAGALGWMFDRRARTELSGSLTAAARR